MDDRLPGLGSAPLKGMTSGFELPGYAQTVNDWRAAGVPVSELRRASWRRPFRGVARLVGAEDAHPQTRIRDAAALLAPDGAIGGWASRWWQGCPYCDGLDRYGAELPVLLHTSARLRRRERAGVEPTRCQLHPDELVELDGLRLTSLARAAYDDARLACDDAEAVVVLDMSVSRVTGGARTTLGEVRRVLARHTKTRGIARVRRAIELATDRSASPWESRMRVFAVTELGMHNWAVNQPIFDQHGRLLGIPDLLDPATGLVLESDGSSHRTPERHRDDNVREERFESSNLTVVRVTSGDHRAPAQLSVRIRDGDRRARARDVRRDSWTLTKPAWWSASALARRWG